MSVLLLDIPVSGSGPPPPVAVDLTARVLAAPRSREWVWVLRNGIEEIEITSVAHGRKLSWVLDGPCSASFTLNGRHPVATSINEMATDLLVYADGVAVYRGRLISSQDDLDANTHTISVDTIDYRGLLQRRELDDNDIIVFEQIDKSDLTWALVSQTQAKPGGDLGITRGSTELTGAMTDREWTPGLKVSDLIDQLAKELNGFDWEISPDLILNLWAPRRARKLDDQLDYGGSVSTLSRQFASSAYANVDRVSGDSSLDPVLRVDPAITTSPFGRWEQSFSFSDVKDATSLASFADMLYTRMSTQPLAYTVVLRQGVWPGVTDMGPGDIAHLAIVSGRINEDRDMRITQVDLDLGDDGQEAVSLTLVEPDFFDPSILGN